MSGFLNVWLSFGLFYSLLLAAVEAAECSEKETLINPTSDKVPPTHLTNCLMECTWMTYYKKLELRDNHNIRLQDSKEGALGEYCWSTELLCSIGDSFLLAYAVLPVDVTAVGHEHLEVKATDRTATALLSHSNLTAIADVCGLRYDVTPHFGTERAGSSFCVRVVVQDDVLGDRVLRCPPLLVTFWRRPQPQANHAGK